MDTVSLSRSIEAAKAQGLTPRGVIGVDLFGLSADYSAIRPIVDAYDMWLIVDGAQSFAATHNGICSARFGDMATTSFFPAKPLGCYGDGGAVFTDNAYYADIARSIRVHGKGSHKYDNERVGLNSRLDTLQAAILLAKLAVYDEEIELRNKVAARYDAGLKGLLDLPVLPGNDSCVWAQYTVKAPSADARSAWTSSLKDQGIPTAVYYPLPLHQQTAYQGALTDPKGLGISEGLSQQVFSLPMHPYMTEDDQNQVIEALRKIIQA